jgi:hypothetical protein
MSQYATVAEFRVFGLPAAATAGLSDDDIDSLLQAASAIVDGMIEARGYPASLTTWDKDLSSAVCKLAAYDVIFHLRGANPADPAHAAIVMSRDWAERHIEKVAKGLAKLAGTTASRNTQATAGVFSTSSDDSDCGPRGW